jgi:3-dehydroquinate synthase
LNLETFGTFSYSKQKAVIVGDNLLDGLGVLIRPYLKSPRIAVIFDELLTTVFQEKILPSLERSAFEILSVPVNGNESVKSLDGLSFLESQLLPFVDRKTTLIVIGGGAIGDAAGFLASILLRGIPWIYLPTTLLSQVDSSIGGKTAINSSFGKNLIGSFHFPLLVLTDTMFLKTLSKRHLAAGFVELSKHALIQDAELFMDLERNHKKLFKCIDLLGPYIFKSIKLKLEIINQDWFEQEQGTRQYLNLGHTFAHAFESMTKGEQGLLHGEAVALGLCAVYDFAAHKDICCSKDAKRVKDYMGSIGMPTDYQNLLSGDQVLAYFKVDKKKRGDKITFILPKGIGKGCHLFTIPESSLNLTFSLFSDN